MEPIDIGIYGFARPAGHGRSGHARGLCRRDGRAGRADLDILGQEGL